MRTEPLSGRPPGFWWIVLLAGSWFLAGFVGPMYFVPDSNIGPIIGVLFSGPAGFVTGLVLFVAFRLVPVRASVQWLMLGVLCLAGVLVTLLLSQPEPKAVGSIVEVEVRRIRPVPEAAPEIRAYWRKRIAEGTWTVPHAGWEQSMAVSLAGDSRVILEAVLLRERMVRITRKPWDRGRLIATPWFTRNESVTYSPAPGAVSPGLTSGTKLHLLLGGIINDSRRVDGWPPQEEFVPYAYVRSLPAEYEQLR